MFEHILIFLVLLVLITSTKALEEFKYKDFIGICINNVLKIRIKMY